MQDRFAEEWADHFGRGKDQDIRAWQANIDPVLLSGNGLRGQGRSTAVEYWHGWGRINYVRAMRRTGSSARAAADGSDITTFHIMAARTQSGAGPAEETVTEAMAAALVELILAEGRLSRQRCGAWGLS